MTMENVIATMEGQKIWDGAAETVQFRAMEDPLPFARCMAHAIQRASAPACWDSGHLIAALNAKEVQIMCVLEKEFAMKQVDVNALKGTEAPLARRVAPD